jgi:hypothetical protein
MSLVEAFIGFFSRIDIELRPRNPCSSLDDFRTLFVQKLVIAIGTEKLDLLVPQLLPVTIELAFALRTGRPKYFRHGCSWYQRNKIRNPNIEIRNKLEVN